MSIHKLTAGSGYDYLTRQVAALDATHKGHVGLASYYTARGEAPGSWTGTGLAGIDGLTAGDPVTAEQMKALFGLGLHPLAAQRMAQLAGPDLTDADYQAVIRLGTPFKVFDNDISPFRVEVARRIAAVNPTDGLPGDWPVPAAIRARIRTKVATEMFRAEHGRDPDGPRELAGIIARLSRPRTDAVAGYDLTFSPVKSVSTLWAVADPTTAAAIERAHQAAVGDALRFLEENALFTRTGANGVRQVNVRGLVAAAFTHRDSRAGDPDLHTHVAIANKVQTLDGRWLSIDGRVLFKANVAASETYNTALETHLRDTLRVRFAERPKLDPRKRPVREIVGVDPALNQRWSTRRVSIEARRGELAAAFQQKHGRPPTPVEMLRLAQQATLETRDAKHEPRSLAEQRHTWHTQAVEVLGSTERAQDMVTRTLGHHAIGARLDAAWLDRAADRVLAAVEERRATWQIWHVRAEAQRQVRAADVPGRRAEELVEQLVDQVLQHRSVRLRGPYDGVREPAVLRRADGASVYTVAGSDLYTSTRILTAEQRLLHHAGRRDGRTVDDAAVEVALLEMVANGVTFNAGQASLVRAMAGSGARLQLAIAPAGTGKTTALSALATAWTGSGGDVIGLAPSAAAAAQLRDQTRCPTDTLAKLTWSIDNNDLPGWAARIGPATLVIIDEAGMADTLSLDTAVQFIVARGGSVRLIGDDQQLAAIGAGGVLRDIQLEHGAGRLTEVLRFTDPAEAAATLALREGRPEALGFYLDQQRIHVGDQATIVEDLFTAWQADRSRGLDALMLAPTRELAAELNQRARTHRLHDSPTAELTVALRDGTDASVGDLVITRANDRRLRVGGTDWVKNGDRWTITTVHRDGALTVKHSQHRRTVHLPASYVGTSVELGYATTVHGAQGVTADTIHGLATGAESRQQLYTMLTRGRAANHVYLQVVGDGDPHSVIHPDTIRPQTPVDLIERILARDDIPHSATTTQHEMRDPAVRLGEATARYLDSLYAAAEDIAGPAVVDRLDTAANQLIPGLTGEPAWPVLRAHLLLLATDGTDPIVDLHAAAGARELDTADDRAAVLDWRLDDTGLRNAGPGPLPWIPAVPHQLATDQTWGPYLKTRAQLISEQAAEVRNQALGADRPAWRISAASVPDQLVADVAVWRAAMQVSPDDRRPTGPLQLQKAARTWQQHLDTALAGPGAPALQEWGPLISQIGRSVATDLFLPVLAERLAAISRTGLNAAQLLHTAINTGPLPDEHGAAALWWRISRHLQPVTANTDHDKPITTPWAEHLTELVGADRAHHLQQDCMWPALVSVVDHALQRGWPLEQLLSPATSHPVDDECQALVWRISQLTHPAPDENPEAYPAPVEPDIDIDPHAVQHQAGRQIQATPQPMGSTGIDRANVQPRLRSVAESENRWVEADLAVAAIVRTAGLPLEQTDRDVRRMISRADAWRDCPVPRERLLTVNQLALEFFQTQFPGSWGQHYLGDRMRLGLTGDPRFAPGQAAPGWTRLVDHLHRHGITDQEMLTAGVTTRARTGRLIDRFRDRITFPITNQNGEVLGFVGRRHPDLGDSPLAGPKYLNTAETPLFYKSAQLFGGQNLGDGRTPVIVEGPIDAIAVTAVSDGRYIGVAPLGTSLTDEQATQLAHFGIDPIVATDADAAGRVAAGRAFWHLAPHGLNPRYAAWPDGTDPADVLTRNGPDTLLAALDRAKSLGEALIEERLAHLPALQARAQAIRIIAAQPPTQWDPSSNQIADRSEIPAEHIRRELLDAVQAWNRDPQVAAQDALTKINAVKTRITPTPTGPEQPWETLAAELDPRLLHQADWPATAALLQAGHHHGHHMAAAARAIVKVAPLGALPAQDLRYRLLAHLDIPIAEPAPPTAKAQVPSHSQKQQAPQISPTPATAPTTTPRR